MFPAAEGLKLSSPPTSFTYDSLLSAKVVKPQVKIVSVHNPVKPDSTIYNGGLFMDKGILRLVARTEKLDEEIATVDEYVFRSSERSFEYDPDHRSQLNCQDPSPAYTPKGIVHTTVKTLSPKKDPKAIKAYRSIITDIHRPRRSTLAKGPLNQKGLKIFYYQGKYLVVVRRRDQTKLGNDHVIDSSSHIGYVNQIWQIKPKFVDKIFKSQDTKIKGFFAPGEWGNVADSMLLLEDGRIAVMGHIAKFSEAQDRHYSVFVGILNPQTLEMSEVQLILTASDLQQKYPNLSPKRPDLMDVVYPRTMGFSQNGEINLIGCVGVADRYTGIFSIPWPFSVLPDFSAPQNSIFNYPYSLIGEILK